MTPRTPGGPPAMTFLSLFAGVGGFDLALTRLGMRCVGQVEIDPVCRSILARHFPEVPRHDDVRTTINWWHAQPRPRLDLVRAGWPCQDVSQAGRRAGLPGARTGLFFELARVVDAPSPGWVLLENAETAPLCTIQGGSGFGDVWLTTSGPSYTLDTSHPHLLALPTRSQPTAHPPLDSPPSLQARSISENQRGEILTTDVAASLSAGGGKPGQGYPAVMIRMAASQGDLDHAAAWSAASTRRAAPAAGGARQAPVVVGALPARSGKGANSTVDDGAMVIHTTRRQFVAGANSQLPAQPASDQDPGLVTVRRLTPRECERLQGFPNDWTALDANRRPITDAAGYRAIGNAVAVPVIAWIGRRLLAADHRHAHVSCRPRRPNPTPISTADAVEVPRA